VTERFVMFAIAVLACGCTKPTTPRQGGGKADGGGGGWSIEGVEPGADASAGVGAERADDARATDSDDGARVPANDDGARSPGAEAGAEPGTGDPLRKPAASGGRVRVVPVDHPQYGRLEGDGLPNACKRDGECFADGCAREVCSAQRGVTTTCEKSPAALPTDASCGCVAGECVWWSRSGTTLPLPKRDGPEPNSGEAPRKSAVVCDGETCKPGQQCIEYYGIAGPSGPRFESCEWPCSKGQSCPKGTACVTIADGPGRVCR
jgi:hypothetical protein